MARKRKTVKDYQQAGHKIGKRRAVEKNVKKSLTLIRRDKKK